jgi:hypothetical protein
MHVTSFLAETLYPNFNSKDTPFICAHPGTHREAWYLSRVDDISRLDIKDTLPLFMKILRAGLDPRALERLWFPPYKIIDSLLTD